MQVSRHSQSMSAARGHVGPVGRRAWDETGEVRGGGTQVPARGQVFDVGRVLKCGPATNAGLKTRLYVLRTCVVM